MRSLIPAAICLAVSSTPAFAIENPVNNATAVGIGAAKSTAISNSNSRATAISGQGGQGGVGVGQGVGSVTIQGTPAQTSQTITTQGHSSVSTVPSVFAPGLAAAGIESCLGSVSGGGSWLGTGITLGGSVPDGGCNARLNARTLWSFGLKKAAVALLCAQADIYNSMPDVCSVYLPRPYAAPVVAPVVYPGAAPVPAGYYYDDINNYRGGGIMLVDGKTGSDRLCDNYDVARKRCRSWHGAVSSAPKPVARPVRSEHQSAVSPPPAEPRHQVAQVTESLGKPLWLQMIHPEQPAAAPSHEEKEVKHEDESTARCLGFCAAAHERR